MEPHPTRREKAFAVLPTMLTLGNAASGFGAITLIAKVGPTNPGGNELFIAALLIYLAMLFDAFDGSAARWANQTSDFGAQLDSLCDAISFGVAPAFLMLQFMVHKFGISVSPAFTFPPRLLWVIAVLFVMCAVLRLARFNVETEEDDSHDFFSGLPSPAAAGVIASFPIATAGLGDLMAGIDVTTQRTFATWFVPAVKLLLPLITLAVACLMVSRIRYPHAFNQWLRGKRGRQHIIQLLFVAVLIAVIHELALPILFCYFAFAPPARALWGETVGRRLYKSRRA